MRKFFVTLMCVIMVVCFMPTVAMAETGSGAAAKIGETEYDTLQAAVDAAVDGQTITLLKAVEGSITIPQGKKMILDLNDKVITGDGTTIKNNGNLTIKDTAGNGRVVSNNNVAVAAGNNSVTTIESGTFEAREGAVITGRSTGATINISGGTFNVSDNAVIAGNGTAREGDSNTINISGGTFNGGIVSAGYVACGIYSPWKDNITVTGGTFNITNGAGVVARAGNVNITGGTFNVYGNTETAGKVGDSAVSVPCSAIVFDSSAGYPAMGNESKILVTGGDFTSPDRVASVKVIMPSEDSNKRISVSGGTFSSDVSVYIVEGTKMVEGSDGKFVLAPADDAVAKIGNVGYTTLQAAVEAADEGQTITLLKAVTVTATVGIMKDLTLDLGGYMVTGDDCRVLNVMKGKLELTGSGTVTSGKKAENGTLDPASSVIRVGNNAAVGEGASKASAELIIGKEVIIAAPDTYGVTVFGSGTEETVTVYGTINATGTRAAISGNGSAGYGGTTINIEDDAKISSANDVAIYHPQKGTLNVKGGEISGTSGIEAKAGTINVTGTPTIKATAETPTYTQNSNGTSTSGYAIAVVDNSDYAGGTKADIKGGTFIGEIAALGDNDVTAENKGTIVVSGGSFNTRIASSYLASGFVQSADGTVKVQAPTGGGSGGGGGAAAPTVQKPIIEAGEGAKVTLSTDGTTATITAQEGYEITDVTVNGVSKGVVTTVRGLKTGDKLVVTAAKKGTSLTEEEQKKAEAIRDFKLIAKSKLTKTKSGKKAIRITWNTSEYKFDGVEVWRSTKKNSGYGNKPMWTIKAKNTKYYYNTAIKKGKTYYYKLRGYVEINGQKYYTPFSSKAYRTVR